MYPIQQRSIPMCIILSLITCGIYGIYWEYCIVQDSNVASNDPYATSGGMVILLSIVIGVVWLISKIVTPQVVTAVSAIAGFLILRFIVRVILQVTFTLLSFLFWLAILCAILLCVL